MDKTKKEAILNAWNQIRIYVKENYNGTFRDGVQFEWKHEVYGKQAFGITPNGIAYTCRGSHGWSYNDYIGHPSKRNYGDDVSANSPYRDFYDNNIANWIEPVVRDWKEIKKIIEHKASEENNLYNFEI